MKKILEAERLKHYNKNFREYAKTRDGLTFVSWVVGLLLVLIASLSLGHINKSYELGVMVFATFILAFCSLITVFARYVDSERFPMSAYFHVGVIFMLSLCSIGLMAIDLSFTLLDRYQNDLESLNTTKYFIVGMWNVIYWGSMLFGSVLSQFFTRYWQNGHFRVWDRIKSTIKGLLVQIIILGVVGVILFFLVFVVIKVQNINGFKAVAMIISNVINMLQLVVLLAYGLFNLPIYLWKFADNKQFLYTELEHADEIRKEYRTAMSDFHTVVSQCRNMIAHHRTGANTAYMDILENELPEKDLDGVVISFSSHFKLDLEDSENVTEDYIANVRNQFRIQYFLYKRKKSRWNETFDSIIRLIEEPQLDKRYLERDLDKIDDLPVLDEMVLKPKPNDKKQITTYRIMSLVSLVYCIFVLTTEATVIYDPHKTLMYLLVEQHPNWKYLNWLFTIAFLASVVFVCFFTIFNSKFSDFLQLVPRHTDCLQLSSVVSLCCKIITVSCFNYMVILGEAAPGMEEYEFGTQYVDFYSSMIKVPFLGSYFNTIMPMFILVFGSFFAVFSLFKLKSKTLTAIKRFTKRNLTEDGAADKEKEKGQLVKKDEESKEAPPVNEEDQTIVQSILKGERAVLLELDLIAKREERNKLLRFNDGLSAVEALRIDKLQNTQQIEMSSKKPVDDSSLSAQAASKKEEPSKPLRPIDLIIAKAKAQQAQTSDKLQPLLSKTSKQQDDSENAKPVKKYTGAQKMTYGQFRKAKIVEEESEPSQHDVSEEKPKRVQKRKNSSSEEEEDDRRPIKKRMQAMPTKKVSAFKKREMRMDLEEDEEEEVIKPKATKSGGSKNLYKEGKVYKKKMKTIFTQWDERYLVLDGEKLFFYSDTSKKTLIRTLSLKTEISSVFFHYDENAPKLSKRIAIKEKDESRFDLYVTKPIPRAFMLKVDNENVWEAEDWINTIQNAIKQFQPKEDV